MVSSIIYETEILKYGLKHGTATCSSKVEMIVIGENVWNQIEQKDYITIS